MENQDLSTRSGTCTSPMTLKKFSEAFKLKRKYDIEALARSYGFDTRLMEKVCRISDILEDLSAIRFLRDHLSLYGGTALVFIYYKEIDRLSIDIDFNYRHLGKKDWEKVRNEIDQRIKVLLSRQEYEQDDIYINPSHPLVRFHVHYRSIQGLKDSFKIEIGYMRRYPILK